MADVKPDARTHSHEHADPHAPPPIPDVLKNGPAKQRSEPSKTASTASALADVSKPLSIAIDFLSMIAAGAGLGWLLDKWRGWAPYGLVVGMIIGFVWGTVRLLRRLNKE